MYEIVNESIADDALSVVMRWVPSASTQPHVRFRVMDVPDLVPHASIRSSEIRAQAICADERLNLLHRFRAQNALLTEPTARGSR